MLESLSGFPLTCMRHAWKRLSELIRNWISWYSLRPPRLLLTRKAFRRFSEGCSVSTLDGCPPHLHAFEFSAQRFLWLLFGKSVGAKSFTRASSKKAKTYEQGHATVINRGRVLLGVRGKCSVNPQLSILSNGWRSNPKKRNFLFLPFEIQRLSLPSSQLKRAVSSDLLSL